MTVLTDKTIHQIGSTFSRIGTSSRALKFQEHPRAQEEPEISGTSSHAQEDPHAPEISGTSSCAPEISGTSSRALKFQEHPHAPRKILMHLKFQEHPHAPRKILTHLKFQEHPHTP